MMYDIRVIHNNQNDPYFQQYVETVEAATAHDAISRVQRKNPGHLVQCDGYYDEPRGSFGGDDASNPLGWIILMAFVFAIWFAIEYWYVVVPCAAVVVAAMLIERYTS